MFAKPNTIGHPQARHETPTRHETTYLLSPRHGRERRETCSAVFKAMHFNAPSITDINPTQNNKNDTESGISKPVVWGACGLHPEFPWFSFRREVEGNGQRGNVPLASHDVSRASRHCLARHSDFKMIWPGPH